ncbi:hypothetical protein LCGC14_0630620 [marine sediment metagenome]|uniref:C1q domain-containing protein n=1 Tax=marine sediment metagenome TaxID=412755 RepID=A0A0F9R1Y2_9ZZZZ
MGIKIEAIVQFIDLIVDDPVSLPHGLVNPPRKLVPDVVAPNEGGFLVTADDTNITVTRLADESPDSVDVWASSWHTIRREFGSTQPQPGIQPDGSLVPQPFIINQGVSESGEAAVTAKIRALVIQAIPAGVNTKVAFDSIDYDFGGIVNIGLDRFVITEPGRYTVTSKYATTAPGAAFTQQLTIAINGIFVETVEELTASIAFGITPVFASDFNLVAGDFLEVFAFLSAGASTLIANGREPVFAIHSNF